MTNKAPGFYITSQKGFHIVFENGYTVSVQFGPGNYCENYDSEISREGDVLAGERGSATAEVAWWGPDGNMIEMGSDFVAGWQTPAQVLALLNKAATQPGQGSGVMRRRTEENDDFL